MKKTFKITSCIFLVLAVLFLIFGIYQVIQSYGYVTTYTSGNAATGSTVFQYVLTSSMAYFGFGFMFLGMSAIIYKQDKILSAQRAEKDESVADEISKADAKTGNASTEGISQNLKEDGEIKQKYELKPEEHPEAENVIEPEPAAETENVTEPESAVETENVTKPEPAAETKNVPESVPKAEAFTEANNVTEPEPVQSQRITSDFIKGIFEDKE